MADLIEQAANIRYRDIRGFKGQLAEDFVIETGIKPFAPVEHRYIGIDAGGKLTIKAGFFWDGPSGPTMDTSTFRRAALVHDALYRLMKSGDLDIAFRKDADLLMRRICLEDGMSRFRANYCYFFVRVFGRGSAR